jgi:TolA-binding protein
LGHFKEALKLFENVLQSYPDSNVADVACYMCGWCYYMLKQDVNALKYFKEFLKTYPQSRWAPHALFWTAEYQYNRGAYNEAEKQFLLERTNYPNSSVADTALFWAGRAALMQNEFRRAINHFSLLIQDYPNSKKRAQARFYQGESLCQLGEFAGAILIFDEIIKQFPNTYLAQKAWLRKGDSHFTLGSEDPKRYQEAIASYQTIMEQEDVSEEMKMEAEYKVGRCLEKLGQRQEAFEHYMKVSYTYFRNQDRSPESNIWFTRAAFNAAAMKEEEKSWSKAINIYQRVVDAHVPASRDASERIKKIQRDHWLFFY